MSKLYINMAFIEALVFDGLSDQEIIQGYMRNYVAQGRCLHDLHMDMVYQYKKYFMDVKKLDAQQISQTLIKVKKVVKTYLVKAFKIPNDRITLGSDFNDQNN